MLNRYENEPRLKNFTETWQFYEALVRPTDTVVVLGPNRSIFRDPSLLFLATLIDPEVGKLIVIDPQASSMSLEEHKQRKKAKGPVSGFGDIKQYRDEIRDLISLGWVLSDPTWPGPAYTALNTGLPSGSVDVLVDHGTTTFIEFNESFGTRSKWWMTKEGKLRKRRAWFSQHFRHYGDILRPGGIYIMQTHNSKYNIYPTSGWIEEHLGLIPLLSKSGMDCVVYYPFIEDKFRIPVPPEVHLYFIKEGFGHETKIDERGQQYLVISPFPHYSPDLYIGMKRST